MGTLQTAHKISLVQRWPSSPTVSGQNNEASKLKCCNCETQHHSSCSRPGAPTEKVADRGLQVAAAAAAATVVSAANHETLAPKDQVWKSLEPTTKKNSTGGDVVVLVTTMQKIMKALMTPET
jgi:hypothetical protein